MKFIYLIALLALTGVLHAQIDTRVDAPAPARTTTDTADKKTDATAEDAKAPQPSPALSGLETLDEGALHDQLTFSGQLSGFADSRAQTTSDGSHLGFASQIGAETKFEHIWRQSSLVVDYSGGFSKGNPGSNLGQNYQEVGVTQLLWRGRWHFMAGGQFTYLPESDFGFNVFRSIPDPTANLNSTAVPTQTVFTQPTVQLHETGMSEVDYQLSRLSSISAYGTFSRQSFDNSNLLNSNQINATLGYNRTLNPRDSVALTYSFGQFSFEDTSPQLQTHTIQLFYAHKFARDLGLKVSVGPQLRSFQNINGAAPGIDANVAGSAELDYQLRHTHLDLGYLRETTSGSGVLVGSLVDQVSLSADRQLSKMWHGTLSMAYAHTSELESFPPGPKQAFNAAYAHVTINRRLSRTVEGFFSYGIQIQNSQTGPSGLAYFGRHLITIGLSFHPQSWLLR